MPRKDDDIEAEAKRQLEIEKAKKRIKDKDPDTIINRGGLLLVAGFALGLLYIYFIRIDLFLLWSLGAIVGGFVVILYGSVMKAHKNPDYFKFKPIWASHGTCDNCHKSTKVSKIKNENICFMCWLKRKK
jgi:hypothetical protein